MSKIAIAIIAAIITFLIVVIFIVIPPTIWLDPPTGEIGTDLKVTAFFFKPTEKVVVTIRNSDEDRTIGLYDYSVSPVGILSFSIITPNYIAGHYKFIISSSRGQYDREFRLNEKINVNQPNLPTYLPKPSGNMIIEPEEGKPGTTFKVTAKSLKPHTMVTVKAEACLNAVCTENKTLYVRKSEQEFTDAEGKITVAIQTDRSWPSGCRYYVSVTDYKDSVSGYFNLQLLPICDCKGRYECGYRGCCSPNYSLPSLTGETITLCNEYNLGLSPVPVIWINFWNTSCPGCAEYMKIIQHIKETWNVGKLKVFTVNCGEDPTTVSTFLANRSYNFFNNTNYPVLFDVDRSVKIRYQPKGDPAHYFIDQKGIIQVVKYGYGSISTESEVTAIVDDIIRQK